MRGTHDMEMARLGYRFKLTCSDQAFSEYGKTLNDIVALAQEYPDRRYEVQPIYQDYTRAQLLSFLEIGQTQALCENILAHEHPGLTAVVMLQWFFHKDYTIRDLQQIVDFLLTHRRPFLCPEDPSSSPAPVSGE